MVANQCVTIRVYYDLYKIVRLRKMAAASIAAVFLISQYIDDHYLSKSLVSFGLKGSHILRSRQAGTARPVC
jgi:hypothetical protein